MKLLLWTLSVYFVQAFTLPEALDKTWEGLKTRNIDAYDVKLIHRPNSETPNDAVSEGVGYGMLLSLFSNDQKYFDIIWTAAEKYMWNGRNYDWRVDVNGNKMSFGAATDAEQDIALSLIFAQRLVEKGQWKGTYKYGDRAQNILDNMWDSKMISSGKNVAPGAGWGGDDFVNPGYFAPAWYRVFAEVDKNHHDWNTVIDHCYHTVQNSVGFSKGLIPDWTTPSGAYYGGNLGYNTYGGGNYMYKDGIRTLWRIGTDYMWNKEERALQYLENAYAFLESKGGAIASNFYTMDGNLLPPDDVWHFDDNKKTRPRREHSPLTIGMWSTVPAALGKDNAQEYVDELLKFYEGGDYWGLKDHVEEDIEHNEMYFDQFLAWFGGVMLNGTWNAIS